MKEFHETVSDCRTCQQSKITSGFIELLHRNVTRLFRCPVELPGFRVGATKLRESNLGMICRNITKEMH